MIEKASAVFSGASGDRYLPPVQPSHFLSRHSRGGLEPQNHSIPLISYQRAVIATYQHGWYKVKKIPVNYLLSQPISKSEISNETVGKTKVAELDRDRLNPFQLEQIYPFAYRGLGWQGG
jgi:hypothetical protein